MPRAWFSVLCGFFLDVGIFWGVPGSFTSIQRDSLEADAAAVLGLLCFLEFVEG